NLESQLMESPEQGRTWTTSGYMARMNGWRWKISTTAWSSSISWSKRSPRITADRRNQDLARLVSPVVFFELLFVESHLLFWGQLTDRFCLTRSGRFAG